MKTGIAVFAHGSSVPEANQAVLEVVCAAAELGGFDLVETAFLELAEPSLPVAVERLVARGATRILVVPYFLTLGIHLRRDLPRIVEEISRIHQGMEIRIAPPLDGHPALSQVLRDRAQEALDHWEAVEGAQ